MEIISLDISESYDDTKNSDIIVSKSIFKERE
jgi:hypothetical protein